MKRLLLAIVFACCTLAVAAQEDGFRVNYQGAKPNIKDFAKAYITSLLNPEDEEPEGDGVSRTGRLSSDNTTVLVSTATTMPRRR